MTDILRFDLKRSKISRNTSVIERVLFSNQDVEESTEAPAIAFKEADVTHVHLARVRIPQGPAMTLLV
jgi:hypothetical protein